MVSHPMGDSQIGVSVNAGRTGVLLQIRDSDCEEARAVLRAEDIPVLIERLQKVAAQILQESKP